MVWDGLPRPRSRLVSEYLEAQARRIVIEWLLAHAPELNRVEFLWGLRKNHRMPNLCTQDYSALSYHGRGALRRMRHRPTLVAAFWKQVRLLDWCIDIMQSSIDGQCTIDKL